MSEQILLIVLLVPLVWCAAVLGMRRLAGNPTPQDLIEKYQLLIMVAPVLLGAAWIAAAPFLPASLPLPLPALIDGGAPLPLAPMASPAHPTRITIDFKPWLCAGPLAIWAIGALVGTTQVLGSLVRLGRIAHRAGQGEIDGVPVRFTDRPAPPLAWGRSTILLPTSLVMQMAPEELRLVIRHEQAHLARRDPLYFAALGLIDALAWFNPFLRTQTQRCRMAAELACDAAASGKTPMEREAYARVLIRTLKHTAGDMLQHAPAAISNVKSGDYRMRLSEIMHATPAARKPKRLWLYGGLAIALVPVTALQFAWAQSPSAAPPASAPAPVSAATAAPAHATSATFLSPVDAPVSVGFGRRKDPKTGKTNLHLGVDFDVPVGTPVRAPADGHVSAVYNYTKAAKSYGKVVEIDHNDGIKTRFAHLDSQQVAVGDTVNAGQVIGTSGNTGTTVIGPHLHFEVWKNGKPVDPAPLLAGKAG